MEKCIFCGIVRGELPSAKVYEDDKCLAVLDINPLAPGHTLVMPKEHYADFLGTPADVVKTVAAALTKVCPAVVKGVSAEGFNLFMANGRCAGQEIDHLHIHVVPRQPGDGIVWGWKRGRYEEGQMEKVRAAIARKI